MSDKKIFLIRHGQSEGNVDPSVYGTVPDHAIKMTDKGRQQILDAASVIKEQFDKFKDVVTGGTPQWCSLFYSPYDRTVESAMILSSNLGIRVQEDYMSPLLIERKWGNLREDLKVADDKKEMFKFWSKPDGGESFCDVYNRVVLFDMWMRKKAKYDNVVIVSHGEFIKVYMMYLMHWDIETFESTPNIKNGQVIMVADTLLCLGSGGK